MKNEVTFSLTMEQALDLREVLTRALNASYSPHVHSLLDATNDGIETAIEQGEDEADRPIPGEDMDGDAASALASAGFGTDEDYGVGREDFGDWDSPLHADHYSE